MPDRGSTVKAMDLLAVLEGPRRRDPLLDVPGARRLDPRRCSAPELADALGLHANTVRLHLERLREAGLVDVEAVHRGTVGRPAARLLARAGRARASASTRPATRCSPGLLAALAERVGADGDDADRHRPRLGRRGRPPHPVAIVRQGARRRAATGSASSPRRPTTPTAPTPTSRSSTARSASWPRRTPSSCATCTAGICEGVVDEVGGGSSRGVRDVVRP